MKRLSSLFLIACSLSLVLCCTEAAAQDKPDSDRKPGFDQPKGDDSRGGDFDKRPDQDEDRRPDDGNKTPNKRPEDGGEFPGDDDFGGGICNLEGHECADKARLACGKAKDFIEEAHEVHRKAADLKAKARALIEEANQLLREAHDFRDLTEDELNACREARRACEAELPEECQEDKELLPEEDELDEDLLPDEDELDEFDDEADGVGDELLEKAEDDCLADDEGDQGTAAAKRRGKNPVVACEACVNRFMRDLNRISAIEKEERAELRDEFKSLRSTCKAEFQNENGGSADEGAEEDTGGKKKKKRGRNKKRGKKRGQTNR